METIQNFGIDQLATAYTTVPALECNKFSSQLVLKLNSQLDSQMLKLDLQYISVYSSICSSVRSSDRT